MSNEIKAKAKEYLKAGLSVMPTKEGKIPAVTTWDALQEKALTDLEIDQLFKGEKIRPEIELERKKGDGTKYIAKGIKTYSKIEGIAIITGAVSGSLEVIDVDAKYDNKGTLWSDLRALLEDNNLELYKSLVIAKTVGKGYHIYYRCSSIDRNLKLASRPTTEEDIKETYTKEIKKGTPEAKAKNKALNERTKVLLETRGEGGYVIAPPTPGYSYLQGDPSTIPTITPEQRDKLLQLSRSFNEIEEVKKVEPKRSTTSATSYSSTGLSPFEDYNSRGDVVELLESKGWEIVSQKGERIQLLRPGSTDSKSSGDFHTGLRVFKVFSTSTEFEPETGYSSSDVFKLLECNGDSKLTYNRLRELGYGEPYRGEKIKPTQVKTERIKVNVVNQINRKTSVISEIGETLKIENIETAKGDIVITSPGPEAGAEVLKAIELSRETGKRIYIKEGGLELVYYKYQLAEIVGRYIEIGKKEEGLSDRNIDSLLAEVVETGSRIDSPIDKDVYKDTFLTLEGIDPLGVTEESLSITMDKLTSTREKENQAKELTKLNSEIAELQKKGETAKALELMEDRAKDIKLQDKTTEYSKLTKLVKEDELRERLSNKPDSLNSGYAIQGEPLLLPSGAITILAAPTSHGKTTFLINLALNVAKEYPHKKVYIFSYEEDEDSILLNAFNTSLDKEISNNNRKTIKSYFTTGSTEYVRAENREYFTSAKDSFFKDLINTNRLNINYSSYNSDNLIEAIRYLYKHENPGAIFIDYIQLLNLPEKKYKTYSRQEEIKQICIDLKDLAVETGLPIILGAQFNRHVQNHLHIHPTRIGEAGDIERIANLIVGFWNNNFKLSGSENEIVEINTRGINQPDTLYMEILKNRGGKVGQGDLLDFNGNKAKIGNRNNFNVNHL